MLLGVIVTGIIIEVLIVSHRGNLEGANPIEENNPYYIMRAVCYGYDVEVDLWYRRNELFLGHDKPKYKIDYWFIMDKHFWIHCKNTEALVYLSCNDKLHLFYHNEGVTYTSKGYLMTAPGEFVSYKSVACMPELTEDWDIKNAYAVCTDYPLRYDKNLS